MVVNRRGAVTWSFGAASGPNRLAKPSLAVRWPNGLIAANDDYNHRVIVIDPRTKRIVWQYGHTGVAGRGAGYLSKPDGLDLLPATDLVPAAATGRPAPRARSGAAHRLAAAARVAPRGGRAPGRSSARARRPRRRVVLGPGAAREPGAASWVARLPVATHDAAAALVGSSAYIFGGGQAVSRDAVVRVDPSTGAATRAGNLGEPLSDLGAASHRRNGVPRGGYTG